jgi:hypothetical protein
MTTINSLTSPVLQSKEEDIDRRFKQITPDCPFGDIALALSGGGFRAAAFSLGVISYLNKAWYNSQEDTLLKHVSFLTSTSGGSITNAFYSASIFKPNFSFTTFYNTLKDSLKGDLILREALDILNDPSKWNEIGHNGQDIEFKKNQNLINSFAKAYDSKLFNLNSTTGENLYGIFFNRDQTPHLKTVCFNATELNNGISFRFQTNGDPESIFTTGNYYLHFINPEIAKLLKISDIVATSSCFPSGFEPIIYPTDFVHNKLQNIDQMFEAIHYGNNNPLKTQEIVNKPFCMVDGGVVDNQGLYSMMMEDNFRAEHPPKKQFDLMMVCDVSSYFNDAYEAPPINKNIFQSLTINKLRLLAPIGLIIFIASILFLSLATGILHNIGVLFILPSIIYTFFYLYTLIKLYQAKSDLLKSSAGKMLNRYIGKFSNINFSRLQQMVATRVSSTVVIVTDLFLKQERRQYYNEFYNMPAYKDRTLSCFIYEFTDQHSITRLQNLETKDHAWWSQHASELDFSLDMKNIATKATSMATTLWFDEDITEQQIMRDNIICCGQFTMCYNLLKHIYRLEILNSRWKTNLDLQALKQRLMDDWNMFNNNTYFML